MNACPPGHALANQAAQINEAHRLARQHAESAVQYAIRCGELLMQQKSKLRHGEFQAWIEANCEFAYATAARYMKAAAQKSTPVDFSTLSELYGNEAKESRAPQQQLQIAPEPVGTKQPIVENVLSIDLSSVGPPMTDEEREYVAKSPERIGRMIADYADRTAESERLAAELQLRWAIANMDIADLADLVIALRRIPDAELLFDELQKRLYGGFDGQLHAVVSGVEVSEIVNLLAESRCALDLRECIDGLMDLVDGSREAFMAHEVRIYVQDLERSELVKLREYIEQVLADDPEAFA